MEKKAFKSCILVSEPFLPDPHFHRSVILITEYNAEGAVGFVLNHPTQLTVQDLFDDFDCPETVFLGGPVGQDSFHFVHTYAQLNGAIEVFPGVFWGGDFEQLKFMYNENLLEEGNIKFIAGYSGWGAGQLDAEIDQNSWIVAQPKSTEIFSNAPELWKQILARLGGQFKWLSQAPDDVRLN
jgi:putative transcriptional regulator